jgi:aminodeoxyfutalosine deaminase
MDEQISTWGARWIAPVSRPPLENAALAVSGGTIREIIPGARSSASHDLGEVALVPQLVNAHTHLEFSSLRQPIGRRGMSITEWIPLVVRHRQQQSESASCGSEAIRRGIEECLSTGSIAVGEIATTPWFDNTGFRSDLVIAGFLERLGNRAEAVEGIVVEAVEWLDRHGEYIDPVWQVAGISPHAPYSTSDLLIQQLIDVSVKRNLPVAMHLAESREELQWVTERKGPFREMLNSLGAVPGKNSFDTMKDYLHALARCTSSLIIHGNYLGREELDLVALNRDRMRMVWCPRTHDWFEHSPWPLEACLERDICIGFGTDSRASNPDLDLWNEMQFAANRRSDIAPDVFLRIATLGGASCLGLDDRLGSLDSGKAARWLEIPLPHPASDVIAGIVFSDSGAQRRRGPTT